jgi:hypothetical protein
VLRLALLAGSCIAAVIAAGAVAHGESRRLFHSFVSKSDGSIRIVLFLHPAAQSDPLVCS